ncbi:SEL1-like repeat protein [Sphingomonas sp. HF-S3]|uniref:SEL1-like repeat protein n=1 Tax=Sphingomonas rustica TaxID=3103142 RepID=A0ABV0BAM5_9SPHN
MGTSLTNMRVLIEGRVRDAAHGDETACYDLGIAYSSGVDGVDIDLVEAHKWFNIAAMSGSERAQQCRAEISSDMTAREILAAQRAARDWLSRSYRLAA